MPVRKQVDDFRTEPLKCRSGGGRREGGGEGQASVWSKSREFDKGFFAFFPVKYFFFTITCNSTFTSRNVYEFLLIN